MNQVMPIVSEQNVSSVCWDAGKVLDLNERKCWNESLYILPGLGYCRKTQMKWRCCNA
jgi:hypothetical protein